MSKFVFSILFALFLSINLFGQCANSIVINSYSAECNGNSSSTVTINVTVEFGNGNNSSTISYNIGGGNVVAVVIEDDNGDIIGQTYMFDVPTCDNFTVILTAWTNPSGSGSSCTDPAPVIAPVILPVEFGDLDLKLNGSVVEVNWSTYTEVNNEKFEILRSTNNKEFLLVGEVEGKVNSTKLNEYQFKDKLSEKSIYYYKIKQIDLDGKYSLF